MALLRIGGKGFQVGLRSMFGDYVTPVTGHCTDDGIINTTR